MTAGLGLAHATAPRTVSHVTESRIERRWKYYRTDCLRHARRDAVVSVEGAMANWKHRHHQAALACINTGIPWRTVLANNLDNPFYTELDRVMQLRAAVARRESRLGRIKGVTRRKHHGHR